MKIGFIGAGSIAQAIAKQALGAGYEVVLSNSRGPETLEPLIKKLGEGAHGGTKLEAADQEIVFLSVPWSRVPSALTDLSFGKNQIVVDTTNPVEAPHFRVADLKGRTSSQIVQNMVGKASLVKAMNTLPPEILSANPNQSKGDRVIFMSGDDLQSKQKVSGIFERMGFAVVDLGDLQSGGVLHQFPGGPLAAQNLIRLPLR